MRRFLILTVLFAILLPNAGWAARSVNCSKQPDGTACDDGDICTANDMCQGGVCKGSPAAADGTFCDDGDHCTLTDTCKNGTCVGSNPVTCPQPPDQCSVAGICNPKNGACSKPKPLANGAPCDDGNACTTDTCQRGTCLGAPKPDGTPCTDGNACTQTDTCQSGACTGANPVTCSALDQCHVAGVCDPGTGACSDPAKPDGAFCDDDDASTGDDVCSGGVCAGTELCGDEPCSCPTGTTLCGGVCVNESIDRNNCGACGNVCDSGTACTNGSCQGACPGGTTPCGNACVNESTDQNNCGACGIACPSGTTCAGGVCQSACDAGTALCNGVCVNENTDPNNCGSCGRVCVVGTCIGGNCVTDQVAASCLPTSSLAVLTQGTAATAYVPMGSWSETATGIIVVQLEPTVGPPTVIATTAPVNSCSSNNASGLTVCTGNDNDVYVLQGTTLLTTVTAGGTGVQTFSGGSCTTCGVATDASTGLAWLAEGTVASSGQLQSLSPLPPPLASVFGPPLDLFGQQTSEDISIDPVRHLILSALENGQFQIIDTMTSAVFNAPGVFLDGNGVPLDLNATAEDCSTGIAVAPAEFSSPPVILLADLSQATYTPGSPGTWVAPTNPQIFPDFSHMVAAGPSAIAVAPGSHLAGVTDEFGGRAFGVVQLPAASGVGTPGAVDYVAANMPDDPAGAAWDMGLDPHPMTAYTSPNSNKALLVVSNVSRTYLALVDMQALLAATRSPGTNTVDPSVDLVANGIVTFVAE